MSLIVKAYYNYVENRQDEIRRFSIEKDQSLGTYEKLIEKILLTFSCLRGKEFSLFWKDSENDMIRFSSEEELKQAFPYMQDGILKIYICIGGDVPNYLNNYNPNYLRRKHLQNYPNKCGQPFSYGPPPFHTLPHGPQLPDIFLAQFEPPFTHRGVVCDACDGKVVGIRYKCDTCQDYDLCHACKDKGFHSEHKFLEIQWPRHVVKKIMKHYGMKPEAYGGHKGKLLCSKNNCNKNENSNSEKDQSKEKETNAEHHSDDHIYRIGNCVKAMLHPMGINVEVEVRPSEEKSTVNRTPNIQKDSFANHVSSTKIVDENINATVAKSVDKGDWMMVDEEIIFTGETNSSANKNIDEAIQKLKSMGFNDEGGWLTALATATKGNISKALDAMQANNLN